MAEQQLMVPIDYTINVNVTKEDTGLPTPNSSNIAIFTADENSIEGDYGVFVTADDALAKVTAGTTLAKMITAMFATNLTLRGNNGQLIIVPTTKAPASAEEFKTLVTTKKKSVPYFGVLIDTFTIADLTDFRTFVDTQDFVYGEAITDYSSINLMELKKTEGVYAGDNVEVAKQVLAAYVSVGTSANWDGTDTALTMNLKSLSPIVAPGKIDTTVLTQLKEKGISAYALTAGESKVYSHKNAGGYWDDKIGGIALRLQIQYNLYNLAANTTSKFGQNEKGVTAFRTAAARAWQKFLDNGFLTKGIEWMGTKTFGDDDTFKRSIVENGYYQYNKPLSTQTPAERATRSVTIQGAGQSAGAIHFITYNATLA